MNKFFIALLGAGMMFSDALAETFVIKNDLGQEVELDYYADTSGIEESEPIAITLAKDESLRLENNAQFWRMEYRYNGMLYSIVRSKDSLKAGGFRGGRRVTLNGSLQNSKIDNPDAIYEIVLVGERAVDLNITDDQSVLTERMQLLDLTIDR